MFLLCMYSGIYGGQRRPPMGPLDTDPYCQNLGSLDSAVSCSYHIDGDPTLDIPACLGVGFLPLGGKSNRQALQRGLCLCA